MKPQTIPMALLGIALTLLGLCFLQSPPCRAQSPKERATIRGDLNLADLVALTPDGRTLVIRTSRGSTPRQLPGKLELWDVPEGKPRASLGYVRFEAVTADSTLLATVSRKRDVE